MKFDTAAGPNPIDRQRVVGKATDRIDGPAKVTGTAPYAYERHDVVQNPAYGAIVGAAIATGTIKRIDTSVAERAPGVLAIVTHENAGKLGKGDNNTAHLLAGPKVEHYDQAVAFVIAETFEQATAAAHLVKVDYDRGKGRFILADEKDTGTKVDSFVPADSAAGNFAAGFAKAAVTIDQTYTTPDHSHAMMEPMATTAEWKNGKLTLWTANQMIAWSKGEVAKTLGLKPDQIRLDAPYVGGGFGGKLFLRADALGAALGSRAIGGRAVKVALPRPLIPNNSTHRPATIQRIRIGADKDGVIAAIGHETWSGDLPGGGPEVAGLQTRQLYRGADRMTTHRLSALDLPEGNAMRAPGEAVGLLALEIAMDELAEKTGVDPVDLRVRNDVQFDPEVGPSRPFSSRKFVECLREGAKAFGWDRRNPLPGQTRDGRWLVGMGVASAFRGNLTGDSAARITVDAKGKVTVETDMTDIGTGSYTIIAQTAAEMLGVDLKDVAVRLGDSDTPASCGSGGQWGGNSSTAGVYAACVKLRDMLAQQAGFNSQDAEFEGGRIKSGEKSVKLGDAAGKGGTTAEDKIVFGDLGKKYAQATFGAHFCEVGVDALTGEVRIRRQSGAFACGRIINPKAARNQVIGGMTMGAGAALMEELVVDPRFGYFVNHDMAEYVVPVHADIPDQHVIFIDELDDKSSPMKAKGVGELGICGAGAAVANAIYNATGIRIRDYPLTIDKIIAGMKAAA